MTQCTMSISCAPEVGHLAARVVPEPAEMVERRGSGCTGAWARGRATCRSRDRGGGAESGGRAEARHDVAVRAACATLMHLADVAAADQLRSLLDSACPERCCVPTCTTRLYRRAAVDHPAAFADEERQRLLDVHVLARRAGHHGHERVPVVGRRDDHGVNVFVVEQLAEVAVALGARRRTRRRPVPGAAGRRRTWPRDRRRAAS